MFDQRVGRFVQEKSKDNELMFCCFAHLLLANIFTTRTTKLTAQSSVSCSY